MTDPTPIPFLNPKVSTPPPPAAVKHPNWFINFFEKVGHDIVDTFKWAPVVAKDTIAIIEATKELEPAFKAALTPIIKDVATIAAQASAAVAEKGVNPLQDIVTIQAIEQLIKDFGTFYPVLVSAFDDIKGIVKTPPAVVTPTEAETTSTPPEVSAPKVMEDVKANAAAPTPAPLFSPKTPIPVTGTANPNTGEVKVTEAETSETKEESKV